VTHAVISAPQATSNSPLIAALRHRLVDAGFTDEGIRQTLNGAAASFLKIQDDGASFFIKGEKGIQMSAAFPPIRIGLAIRTRRTI